MLQLTDQRVHRTRPRASVAKPGTAPDRSRCPLRTVAYSVPLHARNVWLGYGNSIFYTVFGTIYNVAMTMIVAYPLARKDFVGRGTIMFLFTFTMFFNGGLIPT